MRLETSAFASLRAAVRMLLLCLSSCAVFSASAAELLSTAERTWLDKNPQKLVLLFNTEFPPIEYISQSGEFVGLGADVISRIESLLSVSFIKRPADDWNEHLDALRRGECAIAPTIVRTSEREEYAFFTTPYATVPVVIITTKAITGTLTLDTLTGSRVGFVSGYATETYLRDKSLLGDFAIAPAANVSEGLKHVSFGETDVFVENLAVAAYYIHHEGITNLRVAGTTDFSFAWSIGVSRKYPLLYSSIQKALDSIPEDDLVQMRRKWTALETDFGFDPETVRLLKLTAIFAALLLSSLAAITVILKYRLKQRVAGLRRSEERYRSLASNLPVMVNAITTDGLFTFWNKACEEITGYRRDEIVGNPKAMALLYPDAQYREQLSTEWEQLGKVFRNKEILLRTKDGRERCILWTNLPRELSFSEGDSWALGIDITERKQAEDALRASEDKYRSLFNQSVEGIYLHDLQGRIHDVNEMACLQSGYTRDELLQLTVFNGHPDKTQMDEIIRQWNEWQPGQRVTLESEHRRKDGTIYPVEISTGIIEHGDARFMLAIVRDISDRKRAERELKKSLSLLNATLESTADGILVVDREGKVARWNQKFVDLWRIPEEVLATCDDAVLLDHVVSQLSDPDGFIAQVNTLYALPDATSFDFIEFLDGRMFERYSQPQKIGDDIVGRVWSFRDVTARRRAEQERENLQDQLLQAQKMESIGRLAGGVAHDFNNMLMVIGGHLEMALEKINPAQPAYPDLQEIRRAAQRSANLTRQLLGFARKQTIAPKVLDLNDTVEGMLTMLRRLIGENIDLAWLPGTYLGAVKVDPSQIDQILANLCVNARDAIGGVGKVTIETNNVTFDEGYCAEHAGYVPGEYVLLAVSDDGCGMDRETLAHLFEPFFTTKDISEGTGLGLATVYGIVKQNQGFINVYSEPGHGTTFHVYLPRHEVEATSITKDDTSLSLPHGDETILLVEDEPAILKLTTIMLERWGYTVLAAFTPGEAIRLASEYADEIHLLMTDVIMPEMNGRDLASRLLEDRPNMKRLFMSGYTANVIAHHGVLEENVHFIQKPFLMQELSLKVCEALERV